jgi:hypothetical protein
MLVLTVAAVLGAVVHINLSFTQPQGRYLFPALPAIALLVALGLTHLPVAIASRTHVVVPVALGGFNVWCLVFVLIAAFYPPLVRDVKPGMRTLYPAAVSGMRLLTPDLTFRIHDEDPAWTVPAEIRAAEFDTLDLELSSTLPGAPQVTGAVFFATETQPIAAQRRVPFTWRADGRRQVVRVPLRAHSEWRGTIPILCIDPIDDSAVDPRHHDIVLGPICIFASRWDMPGSPRATH